MVKLDSYTKTYCVAIKVLLRKEIVKLDIFKWIEYICVDGDGDCIFRLNKIKIIEECGYFF